MRDYLTFSLALDDYSLLSPVSLEEMFTPMVSNHGAVFPYGLGWFVQTLEELEVAWHYGWWDATSSLVIKVPERELAFVIMANSDMLSRAFVRDCYFGSIMDHGVGRFFIDTFVIGDAALPLTPPESE